MAAAVAVLLRELFLCSALFFILRRLLARRQKLPPGPRGFPVLGALPLLGAAPHVTLARMAKRYGPVMHLKMGQFHVVVASSPAAARVFLKTLDHVFSDRPLDAAPIRLAYGGQDLVFACYGPRWKLLRKLCNIEMLGARALDAWAAMRRDEAGRMLREMRAAGAAGEVVPIGSTLIYTIANMIGRVILSSRVFETKDSEANEFKDMVVELMTLAGLVNIGDFIPAVAWMDLQGLEGRMKRLHKKFDAVLSRMVAEHAASRGERERSGRLDLLDAVMAAASGEGEGLTEDNVKALLLNLFSAGTDTSTGTIEWAMAELLLNPAILRRAQAEMDLVVGRARRLEESDIPNLPYLQAICKESFRKHPSTPLNLPRVATQPCEVAGYYIPKNTKLLVNIWAIGRDPEVWANPLEFDPGRFATAEAAKIDPRSGNDFELIPFGAGRRICAGARMGVVLVQYLLGSLIHAFDWEMPRGEKMDMGEAFGIALQKAVPLAALVTPRLEPGAYDD